MTPAEIRRWKAEQERELRVSREENSRLRLAAIVAAHPLRTGSYDEQMSQQIAEGQARQLRATTFFRGQ